MELRCENCGELIDENSDPDPSLSSDALPSEDLLCQKCRFLLEAQTEE
jgi:RNA polymerase subunit RPABC4/transcription elongation factor Spt4